MSTPLRRLAFGLIVALGAISVLVYWRGMGDSEARLSQLQQAMQSLSPPAGTHLVDSRELARPGQASISSRYDAASSTQEGVRAHYERALNNAGYELVEHKKLIGGTITCFAKQGELSASLELRDSRIEGFDYAVTLTWGYKTCP